jgi:hypothetical protein
MLTRPPAAQHAAAASHDAGAARPCVPSRRRVYTAAVRAARGVYRVPYRRAAGAARGAATLLGPGVAHIDDVLLRRGDVLSDSD